MEKRNSYVLFFMIIWTILTILAVSWGTRVDWPDNIHVNYGFPFVWSIQTLSTIAGSVNLWAVDVTALVMDLAFWSGVMLVAASALLHFLSRKALGKENQ